MSTCHANGPGEALRRLETMVLMGDVDLPHAAVREQVVSAVDLVVHVARLAEGRRRVVAVAEPAGVDADGRVCIRTLADVGQVIALPERARRSPLAGEPEPGWVGR